MICGTDGAAQAAPFQNKIKNSFSAACEALLFLTIMRPILVCYYAFVGRDCWRSLLLNIPHSYNLRGSPEFLVVAVTLLPVDVVALEQGDAGVELER